MLDADDNIIFCKPPARQTAFFDAINLNAFSSRLSAGRVTNVAPCNAGAIISAAGGRRGIGIQRDFHLQRLPSRSSPASLSCPVRWWRYANAKPGKAIQRLTVKTDNHVSGFHPGLRRTELGKTSPDKSATLNVQAWNASAISAVISVPLIPQQSAFDFAELNQLLRQRLRHIEGIKPRRCPTGARSRY